MEEANFSTNNQISEKKSLFRNAPFWLFILVVFLLPIFFVPVSYGHLFFSKQIIFGGITILVLAVTLLGFLRKGKIKYLPGLLSKSIVAVLGTTFLSAILSGTPKLSLFGQGFEPSIWISLFIGFSAVVLIALFFNSKEKVFYGYLAILISVVILALFHILRFIFGADFLSLGLFNTTTSNTVGRFSDLGILFGLVFIMNLIILELFNLKGLPKILSYVLLGVSFVFLLVANISFVWALIGLFTLILAVYLFSFSGSGSDKMFSGSGEMSDEFLGQEEKTSSSNKSKKRTPILVLIVLACSVIAYLSGAYIENTISSKLNISKIDVRPNWSSTYNISVQTLKNDPIFGAGLNKFSNQWALFKDPSINQDVFWNTDFDYGIGFIPTFATTSGTLGILAWLWFLVAFAYLGIKSIFSPAPDKVGRFLTLISFWGALFLWLVLIFYAPSNTIVAMTFVLTGFFLASLVNEKILKFEDFDLSTSSKKNFISALIIILAIVVVLSFGYVLVKNYTANLIFQKGMYEANFAGNLDKAESSFVRATSLSDQDIFYRALTDVGLVRVSNILASTNSKAKAKVSDDQRALFQNALGITLSNAEKALDINNSNYQNWLNLGKVYEAIVPLGVEGAYQNARGAYEQAVFLNPFNPGIRLILARLEVVNKNNDSAREFINQALNLKPNYTEAAYLLSQIEVSENNTKGAIESLKAAAILSPNDPIVFFRLGLLQYNNRDYKDSVDALSRAVLLNPFFANARYFLGLAFEKTGDDSSAIEQFEQIKLTNPDNEEVKQILKNLKAGRYALSGLSTPTERDEPPIDENE